MQRVLISATLLASAALVLVGPIAAAPASEAAEATKVEIKTADKQKVQAVFFEPRKTTQLAPGAILVHDSGGSRVQLMDLAERMWKTGFAVLVLDLRGHGASATKELNWSKMDKAERKTAWALAVRDLEAAASWLRKQKSVHSTNLNLVGYKAGCALAARHALRDENVRAVALIEPRAEELGIDVVGDLTELGGLPTYIISLKENSEAAEAMIQEAHTAAGGHPYIELMICSAPRPQQDAPSIERKVLVGIARWMKEKAFPQK